MTLPAVRYKGTDEFWGRFSRFLETPNESDWPRMERRRQTTLLTRAIPHLLRRAFASP
jgi:hypothetical protein